MKYSRMIALSAVTTALCTVLLVLGAYVELFDLSCLFLASLTLMIPLAKEFRLGCFLSFVASAILGFLLTGARFQILIPFVMFFGLHPLVNNLIVKYNVNKIVAKIVKAVWFVGSLLVAYAFTSLFVVENEIIRQYAYPILIVGGIAAFFIYDYFMEKFQVMVTSLVKRLKL